ncbi:hypothetical protein [Kitasatospora sp. GP82]|uniref:hypothetical protein n=1 Tax=Kitasatospora sp. GP82 TaxID=3035089 RepID=UPI0024740DB1|nr:hypothetical protein [Kitasatospora sp. GP82]MDH6129613.1 hypothetical protein [Kitasatospora sp. GP82]
MKRLLDAAGIAATAVALCLTTVTNAGAATGTLTVSGNRLQDPPQGCYTGDFWPLVVQNRTDTVVYVFDDTNCQGNQNGMVRPGREGTFEFGGSVYVPR